MQGVDEKIKPCCKGLGEYRFWSAKAKEILAADPMPPFREVLDAVLRLHRAIGGLDQLNADKVRPCDDCMVYLRDMVYEMDDATVGAAIKKAIAEHRLKS